MGDCIGSSVEVDPTTVRKEMMLYGRVKVLRDLWLDDICVPIDVEMEKESSEARNALPKERRIEAILCPNHQLTGGEDDRGISAAQRWWKKTTYAFRF